MVKVDALDAVVVAGLPWVFSQQPLGHPPLLRSEPFCRAARDRGIKLDIATLRELYRLGLVLPLLEIRGRRVRPPISLLPDEAAQRPLQTNQYEVLRALKAGRLADPAVDRRRRPPAFWRTSSSPRWWDGLLYSPYQLLGLVSLRPRLAQRRYLDRDLRRVRLGRPSFLSDDEADAARFRRLAVALGTLDTHYGPEITSSLSGIGVEQWNRYRAAFDPAATLTMLGWPAPDLVTEAERLLLRAQHLDPLGKWAPLVWRSPWQWATLRGDARIALDYRIASELLLRFHEDLAGTGATEPLPEVFHLNWQRQRQRVSVRDKPLDQVLSSLGVSPHPRVVLIVEGETEEYLVPKVFEQLGVPDDSRWIQVVVMRSIDADLTKLAAYAAAPILGQRQRQDWLLIKPPTRLIVAVDPESDFEHPEAERQKILTEIHAVVAAQLGVAKERVGEEVVLDELDGLVQVRTWQGGCFEFAHFTPSQLADALIAVHPLHGGLDHDRLVAALTRHRDLGQDIKQVWTNWRPRPPSKVELARRLWPALETSIRQALEGSMMLPQIAQVVLDADRLAQAQPSGQFVLTGKRTSQHT